jgi:tripartite-type tricarboxylate transporter receptor subunit TctC
MDKYKTPDGARRLAKVILASGEFGRPLVTPPGVPADRLKILREAFDKSVNDPGIKADAEKRRLEMDPASGAELESLAREVMSTPSDVVQRVQKLLGK